MSSKATVQSPAAYDRRVLTGATIAGRMNRQQVGARVFPRTARELGALVTPSDFGVPDLPRLQLERYGAVYDGVTDCSPAFAAAIAVAKFIGGAVIEVGGGECYIGDDQVAVAIDDDRIYIEGQGQNVTQIIYKPANAAASGNMDDLNVAFKFSKNGGGSIVQCGLSKMTFFSDGNTHQKTMVLFRDSRQCKVHDMGCNLDAWEGTLAEGIHTYGRDHMSGYNLAILCARPIIFDNNEDHASLHVDHFHFFDVEIGSTNDGKGYDIADGVKITNLTIDGRQSDNLSRYGVYWLDTTSGAASYGLRICGLRPEQADPDIDGFSIFLSTTQTLQTLTISDCYLDQFRGGIYLRGALRVGLDRVTATSGSTSYVPGVKKHLDIVGQSGTIIEARSCYWNTGGQVTLASLQFKQEMHQSLTGAPLPDSFTLVFEPAAVINQTPIKTFGLKEWKWRGSMTSNQTINTPVTSALATIAGIVVRAKGATKYVAGGATWNNAAAMLKDWGPADFVVTNTATAIRVLDNGSGNLIVINALGETVTATISIEYE